MIPVTVSEADKVNADLWLNWVGGRLGLIHSVRAQNWKGKEATPPTVRRGKSQKWAKPRAEARGFVHSDEVLDQPIESGLQMVHSGTKALADILNRISNQTSSSKGRARFMSPTCKQSTKIHYYSFKRIHLRLVFYNYLIKERDR